MIGYIEIIAGTLGGGKSFAAVEKIYHHLKKGGYSYTNIEVYKDKVAEKMFEEGLLFDPSRLVILDGKTIGSFVNQIARGTNDSAVMVAIDEAHLEWNSRDYQTTKNDPQAKEMLNFITLVRKLDIILLFITQSPEDIDKQLRKKAAFLTMCRNYHGYRMFGFIPFPFKVFARARFDISVGNKKPLKLSTDIFPFPKWVGKLYNSDALLGEHAEKFNTLQTVHASALQKRVYDKPRTSFALPLLACFASSFVGLWL